ncbi:response regulator [Hymenobacter sp. CRA2]|uniref:response regulator n=1 Tax=Hymenobacter sp. CRA2 TaxID=1955620 RepID=UPI00098E9DB3|nr:response regulator [Hymenobacter sp. CRA2]OON68914.1 hypothetical protein B0919_12160 [Hymenobacter sp. CRA2]
MHPLAAILLVDDDPSTNFLNEATLYSLRLTDTYWAAKNGAEAIAMLKRQEVSASPSRPILVLLDIAMPVMGGMEFLEALETLPRELQASVVVVVLAVSMTSDDLSRIGKYPVAGTVSKPLTGEKLTTILQLHFNAQGLGQLPPAQG